MRLRSKLILGFFLTSTLVSLTLAVFLYRFVDQQLRGELRGRLRDIAYVGAHNLDFEAYGRLRAGVGPNVREADVSRIEQSDDYKKLDRQLDAIRGAEPELIRYAYLMVPTPDPKLARFVVDADVLDPINPAEELSHYNQTFPIGDVPGLQRALAECTPVVEDDFVWDPEFRVYSVSAYMPIGGRPGDCLGVLGVDITDRNMRRALEAAKGLAIQLCLAAIALALIVSITMGSLLTRSVLELSKTVKRFTEKDFTARTRILSHDEIGQLGEGFNQMAATIELHSGNLERLVEERTRELATEKQTSERLLLNVLPSPIAERLKRGEGLIVDRFDDVSVLFADLVGFTEMSSHTTPESLVTMLNEVFSQFDRLAGVHGLEKIKTIGDAYMVVAGIPDPHADHVKAIARMALDMMEALKDYEARSGTALSIRIGIHTGSVVAGVIGKKKFIYDLWGDTVNTASRMESHGVPDKICVTEETYVRLRDDFELELRGDVELKGKGRVRAWVLVREKPRAGG